jgi:chromodomain-helicase-DNA-binding protein 4
MTEKGEDDGFYVNYVESESEKLKISGAKETFQPLSRHNDFRKRHRDVCDTCQRKFDGEGHNILIFCQGCSISYHKECLGQRIGRQHLVTKVNEKNFVLHCRRCVDFTFSLRSQGSQLSLCQVCTEPGYACAPFKERRTPSQEQKDRELNNGIDPITSVDEKCLNNKENVLFRCISCFRGFHWHHLPSLDPEVEEVENFEADADDRFEEYCVSWQCRDCCNRKSDVQRLVAWRPLNEDTYVSGSNYDEVEEDNKEYLIKWKSHSYSQCTWMHGAWVSGIVSTAMKRAFIKRVEESWLPIMNAKDAIPEDYLRVDIIYDIRFVDTAPSHSIELYLARINKISQALVKFQGLNCDDIVWDEPPKPDEGIIWTDFVRAYQDWVQGKFILPPEQIDMQHRMMSIKTANFECDLLRKKQSTTLSGGKLMDYQMEGLNWLYYKWSRGQNAILADEMGLGKTIQVIGLLDIIVHSHQCWPFLIVVPNSTCANWRREIQHWAPSLRVVTYFGPKNSLEYSQQYELFHQKNKKLKCHVVVTSFQTPVDHPQVFKAIPWQGMVIDEGQRLKSDKSLLYKALEAFSTPFKLLLTGTPLQNNLRELFNLLQFLKPDIDAAALELKYTELNQNNVAELHELIRPFFLRRTKVQVLTFLPPVAEIIVPVSMSPVQKKLYKSILARNPDLIKSLFTQSSNKLKSNERHSLNNILMQLRKCLCHPFVYSNDIEERGLSEATIHRNLVEASSKLQLLEIMLPKLRDRGHRVLIFSQFLAQLDIVQDFLSVLGLRHERLDGSMSSLVKQRKIDAFNAPDSILFAFLLSTRAGGVGINLATADTVILMDPDFNPHQDIQALSRAHRIGQKKKVLVFHLMTRDSAEERIMQIGKKKLSMDHVVIEHMAAEDDEDVDVESILRTREKETYNMTLNR